MKIEPEREMLGHGGHRGFSAPARVTVRSARKTEAPFLRRSGLPTLLQHSGEARVARGDELRSVVEGRAVNPPTRKPPAHAAAFVEHEHAVTRALQFRSRDQPRHPGADDQHIRGLFSLVHSAFHAPVCSRGKQCEAHKFRARRDD